VKRKNHLYFNNISQNKAKNSNKNITWKSSSSTFTWTLPSILFLSFALHALYLSLSLSLSLSSPILPVHQDYYYQRNISINYFYCAIKLYLLHHLLIYFLFLFFFNSVLVFLQLNRVVHWYTGLLIILAFLLINNRPWLFVLFVSGPSSDLMNQTE